MKFKLITMATLVLVAFCLGTSTVFGQDEEFQNPEPETNAQCEARQGNIKTRSENLIRMADEMLYKFDTIVLSVQNFYTNKVLVKGLEVSNYTMLLEDIEAKKLVVQSSLDNAEDEAMVFSCDLEDPKSQVMQFVSEMQSVKTSLKEYKTSIKNLIVAVHSVNGTTNSNKETRPFRPQNQKSR